MVLINGVKYACERCIRGHRVTTCTHTDQPLTMIKPKGRPASQCLHCREQRKLKNLHINCNCKTKGHSSNCFKNPNGCTCYQNHKNRQKKIINNQISPAIDSSNSSNDEKIGSGETNGMIFDSLNTSVDDYLMDNSLLNFQKIFDKPLTDDDLGNINFNELDTSKYESLNIFDSNINEIDLKDSDFVKSEESDDVSSDIKLNTVSPTYFPLFPLVGGGSFETSESMPMTSIPDDMKKSLDTPNHSSPNLTHHNIPMNAINMNLSHNHSVNGSINGSNRPTRPASVLSINSNNSVDKFDAFPPSLHASSSTTNLKSINSTLGRSNSVNSNQRSSRNNSITNSIQNTHTLHGLNNPIMETNEFYVSDEDIEHFLNDLNNKNEFFK